MQMLIATYTIALWIKWKCSVKTLCRLRVSLLLSFQTLLASDFLQPLPELLALIILTRLAAETSLRQCQHSYPCCREPSVCFPPLVPAQLHSFIFFQTPFLLMVRGHNTVPWKLPLGLQLLLPKLRHFLFHNDPQKIVTYLLQGHKRNMPIHLWPENVSEFFSEGLYIA